MENASYIALSNQVALRRQLDIVANNIANANTGGFKAERLLFTEYLANIKNSAEPQIAFPQDISIARNYDEGPITTTGNPLDFAIHGNAFFTLNTANGPRYTRAGSFTLNGQGQIVDTEGNPLLDDRGSPIVIPRDQSQITVSADGTVSTETGQVARLGLVRFDNPQVLREEAAGLYVANNVQPTPASGAKVVQGSIEGSNVSPILEISRLIEVSRSYQDAQKLLDSENERQKQAIDGLTRDA